MVLGLVSSVFILGTKTGRDHLLNLVGRISASENFSLNLHNLDLGKTWSLEYLTLNDAQGTWLELRQVHLTPRFLPLLRGRIHFDQVGIKHIALHRLPGSDNPTSSSSSPALYLPPVTILHLDLQHIVLNEAALGQRAELGIQGNLSMDTSVAQGALDVVHFHRPQDHLTLRGNFHPKKQQLKLDLKGHEDPGGLIAHIMGLDGELNINLQGHGPLTAWPVTLDLGLADLAEAKARGTLHLDTRSQQIEIQGNIKLGKIGFGYLPLPDPEIYFSGQGSMFTDKILAQAQIKTAAAMLDVNATWTQATQNLQAFFQARSGDLSTLLPPKIVAGVTTINGKIFLDALQAEIVSKVSASDWMIQDMSLETLEAQARIVKPFKDSSWQSQLAFSTIGPDLGPGLGQWNGTLDMGGHDDVVHVHQGLIESEALSINMTGSFGQALESTATLMAQNLKINDQIYSGQVRSQFKGHVYLQEQTLDGQLQVQTKDITGLPPAVEQILGSPLALSSKFQVTPELITIHDFTLGPNLSLKAHAEIKPQDQSFAAKFSATMPKIDIDPAHLAAGTTLEGEAQGSFSSFDLDLKGQLPGLKVQNFHLGPTTLTTTIKDLPSSPQSALAMQTSINQEPLSLDLAAKIQKNTLTLSKARATLPQAVLDLEGNLSLDNFLFNGQSRFSSSDLASLGHIVGLPLSGSLSLDAKIFDGQGIQAASLKGQGKNLNIADFTVQDLALDSELHLLDPLQDLTLTAQGSFAGPSALVLDDIKLMALAKDYKLTLDLDARQDETQTSVASQALVDLSQEQTQISIKKITGTFLSQELQLKTPITITLGAGKTQWSKTHLTLGPATLSSTGIIDATQAHIEASLNQANTGQLAHFFPDLPKAELSSELKIRGTQDNPTIDVDFRMQNIRLQGWELTGLPPLHAHASAHVQTGQFEAQAKVFEHQDKPLISTTFACPWLIHLLSPVSPPSSTPITGELLAHTDLNLLPHLLHLDDQIMAGKTEVQLTFGGTLETPTILGSAHIHNGRYENFRTGTRLEEMQLKATAQGTNIDLHLEAHDGHEGQLKATAAANPNSLEANLDIQNMRLMDSDLVQSTAHGKISLTHNTTQSKIQGRLTLDPTLVRLPATMPADFVLLDIEEIHTAPAKTPKNTASALPDIKLDIGIKFPARLLVRGRGLDSEWSGNLKITGTQNNPLIAGQMELLRGKFDFLDRIFTLTKGNILLDGENPPNPFLDIVGEVQVMDTLILVQIHGPGKNFQVTLSSTPVLPQDELLSLILFGRSLQQISPFQAVRLAQAAATLAGVGGDLDFFNSIKSTLGLQEIEIGKDDDDNTNVGLGGYVGGKYYVRTQRSVSGQDKTKIEIQLTPKISVETEIGGDSRQGGGVNWKRDY